MKNVLETSAVREDRDHGEHLRAGNSREHWQHGRCADASGSELNTSEHNPCDWMTPSNRNRGGPGVSRTRDLRFRKPLLYPSELRGLVL